MLRRPGPVGCDGWSRPSPEAGRDEAQGGCLSPAGTGAITAIFSTRHPATPHRLWRGRGLCLTDSCPERQKQVCELWCTRTFLLWQWAAKQSCCSDALTSKPMCCSSCCSFRAQICKVLQGRRKGLVMAEVSTQQDVVVVGSELPIRDIWTHRDGCI